MIESQGINIIQKIHQKLFNVVPLDGNNIIGKRLKLIIELTKFENHQVKIDIELTKFENHQVKHQFEITDLKVDNFDTLQNQQLFKVVKSCKKLDLATDVNPLIRNNKK